MRNKLFILVIAFLVLNAIRPSLMAQSELVTGYYDQDNDWFVFEWYRSEHGKTTTIYDPPNKVKPEIMALVTHDGNTFRYNFLVTNQKDAVQPVYLILVGHGTAIYNATQPSAEWSSGEYRGKDAWEWAKVGGEVPGIKSGETIKGFSFESGGIPTIVIVGFTGYERAEYSPPYGDYDTDETADSFDRVLKSFKLQYPEKFEYIKGKTIGPTSPPEDFRPIEFLDNIIKMKHEAYTLGWIKNKGIEQSLDAKLENAKKKITQGKTDTAKEILKAFINEVEAQGCETYEDCPTGKHLTSEAYSLLKYNAEYLIDNLPK